MAIDALPRAAPILVPATIASEATSFDERWNAWQAKGAAADRAARRKLAVAVPILLIIAAVIFYTLIGR